LIEIPRQLLCGRRPIKRGVITDCPKERFFVVEILAILAQALPGKDALRILLLIDLALPTFVGPGEVPNRIRGERERDIVRGIVLSLRWRPQ
jgi:hypothetical protein